MAPARPISREADQNGSGADGHDGDGRNELLDLTATVSVADEVDTLTSGLWTV